MRFAAPDWNGLYRIGGAAALLCAAMYLVTMAVYLPANMASPPPATVTGWSALFQARPVVGLFFLGLADIVIAILWCPLSLGLAAVLAPARRAWSMVATAFVLIGAAVFLAANTAFPMLVLSRQYEVASPEMQPALLAAGQALLAAGEGRYAGMPLAWVGGAVLSALMRRNAAFPKGLAWPGIMGLTLLAAGAPFAGYTPSARPASPLTTAVIALT